MKQLKYSYPENATDAQKRAIRRAGRAAARGEQPSEPKPLKYDYPAELNTPEKRQAYRRQQRKLNRESGQ